MPAEQIVNRYARKYIQAASSHGYDLETVLNHSGILSKKCAGNQFTLSELMKLSRNVKVLLQDEFFGLTQSGCKIGAYEMMVDIALSAPTLIDALRKVFRFYSLLSTDIHFSLFEDKGQAIIQVQIAHPELDHDNFLCEWWLLNLWSLASWLVGEKIRCQRFEFPHRSEIDEIEYRHAFATECRFCQPHARLLFSAEYLRRPVVKNAMNIAELFTIRDQFGEIPGTTEALAQRLKGILMSYFSQHREFPPLSYGAEQCQLPNHTLRRRLVEEGTSFTKIKDDIRQDVILKLLRTNKSLNEITQLSGFADTSSLARAVKNWTGMYPKHYKDWLNSAH